MIETLNGFERDAEKASQRHIVFVHSLFGAKQRMMSAPYALTPRAIEELRAEMESIAWTHIDGERQLIGDILQEVSGNARRDAILHLGIATAQSEEDAPSEALNASQSASATYLSLELLNQIGRDVNQIMRDYRNAGIRAEIMKASKGITHYQAVMKIAIDDMSERHRVWFRDRAGRRIPSQKYIRKLFRQVIRDHYMMVYAHTLAEHGQTQAAIWHPDPKNRYHGWVVELDEPDYGLEDIESVFHPTSDALLVARSYLMEYAA